MSSTPIPNYDSEFCGKLPIHLINTIQPYGALLILDKDSLQVIQASENVDAIFGLPVTTLVRTELAPLLDKETLTFLKGLAAGPIADRIPGPWTIGNQRFLALHHVREKYILAEIEIHGYEEDNRSFINVFQGIKYSMSLIDAAKTPDEACKVAAREIKRISGFDKVMIYRFDKEWNGTVIAEEMEDDMESYYGFTFPASDIPRQARELYLKNPYRYIPDKDFLPVKLYPVMNPLTRGFVDLSDCNVRGVTSVHIEYLTNMGVTASMSTRILHNDNLWGLIACHHKTAREHSYELCSIFELLSHTISSRIFSLHNKEHHEGRNRLQDNYTRLVELIYEEKDLARGLPTLLSLFNAHGAILVQNGRIKAREGNIPDAGKLEELLLWLHTRQLSKLFSTDHLSGSFDRAANYIDTASGLLAIPAGKNKEDLLLLFRPEVIRTIDWGGDPGGRIVFEKDEKNYHPRHSFKLWRQIVGGSSAPWKEEELAVAETLRSFLYEYSDK